MLLDAYRHPHVYRLDVREARQFLDKLVALRRRRQHRQHAQGDARCYVFLVDPEGDPGEKDDKSRRKVGPHYVIPNLSP